MSRRSKSASTPALCDDAVARGACSIRAMAVTLPDRPPFALRARVLTPLAAGGTRYEADGRIDVDAAGRIAAVGPWTDDAPGASAAIDLRPLLVLPGMVDLHVHLPQLPNAGVGAGLDLLTWLRTYIFPLERAFDEEAAERLAPLAFRAFAAAGTTTAVMYGAVFQTVARRRVPGGRGPRDPGGHRQGDDGSRQLRRHAVVRPRPRHEPAAVRGPVRPMAPARRGAPPLRVHAAVRPVVRARTCCAAPPSSRARPAPTGRRTWPRTATRSARSPRRSPTPSTTSTSTTRPAASGRGRSSPTRSTCRRARSPASPRPIRSSRTVRRRTCSSPRARCPWPATGRPGSAWAWARTSPPARSSRSSPTCAPAATSRAACACSPRNGASRATTRRRWARWTGSAWARTRGRGRSGRRTRSGRSRRARRPT